MAGYSWQRHLVTQGAYADWVDRGRLRPTHRQWSYYLREVAEKAEAEIVAGEVAGLETNGGRWRLALKEGEAIWADGVVFTGAGPPISVPGQPRQHPRVFDGRSYWLAERTLATEVAHSVCVIGNGETAASVVISLLAKSHKRSTVDVVTSRGFLYSRGESYAENRFFSDPGDWPHLAEAHRREFLERTDRGVFSAQAEAILNASHGFRTRPAARCGSKPASSRSSSPSSTAANASGSPTTRLSSRSASRPAGSRGCSAPRPAAGLPARWRGTSSTGGSMSTCRSAA